MDVRNRVKNVLKMCGHALVSTIHVRMDTVEHQLTTINDQNNNIAVTQTALLHAAIHSIEVQQQMQIKMQEEIDSLKRTLEAHGLKQPSPNGDRPLELHKAG